MPSHIEKEEPAVQPYLEYLDKEQTVQGILCSFCILTVAGLVTKVLLAPSNTGSFINYLQGVGFGYVLATLISFSAAAFLFYQQRSQLLGLHGYLVLALAQEAVPKGRRRADSWTFEEALLYADSYSLWNPYQCALGALYTAAAEALLGLFMARVKPATAISSPWPWSLSSLLLLITTVALLFVLSRRNHLDKEISQKTPRKKRRI